MKTGLGLRRKLMWCLALTNLILFRIRNYFLGFEYANIYIKQLDKKSLELVLKKFGAQIGKNCDVETGMTFHNCRDYSNLKIGSNCHVGKNCFFDLKDKVEISDNVVISMQTTFITHQDLNKSELKGVFPASKNKITIKNDCYIGADSTILKGVVINEFSVVAAGSVVNKDVPAHCIVGGIPARFIREV